MTDHYSSMIDVKLDSDLSCAQTALKPESLHRVRRARNRLLLEPIRRALLTLSPNVAAAKAAKFCNPALVPFLQRHFYATSKRDTGDGIEVMVLDTMRNVYKLRTTVDAPESEIELNAMSDLMTNMIVETLSVEGGEIVNLTRVTPETLDQSSEFRTLGLTFVALDGKHIECVTNNYDPERLEQIRSKIGFGHFAVLRGADNIVLASPRALYFALMARWFGRLNGVDVGLSSAIAGTSLVTYAYKPRRNNEHGQYRRGRGIYCGRDERGHVYVMSRRGVVDIRTVDLSACSRIPPSNILHVKLISE